MRYRNPSKETRQMLYCILPFKLTLSPPPPTLPRNYFHGQNGAWNPMMPSPGDTSAFLVELACHYKAKPTSNIDSVAVEGAPIAPPGNTDTALPVCASSGTAGDEVVEEHEVGELKVEESESGSEDEETCLLYTSPSPRDQRGSRMPSSA